MQEGVFIQELVFIVGAATLVSILGRYLRLPLILSFLVSGLILGPNGFSLISSSPSVTLFAELTAMLLLFLIGLEFSVEDILRQKFSIFFHGGLQFLLTIMIFYPILNAFLGYNPATSIYLSGLFAFSSTALVFRLLEQTREVRSAYGQLSLSILLFQDLAIIPFLLFVQNFLLGKAPQTLMLNAGWMLFIKGLLVIGILMIGARFIVPLILDQTSKVKSREVFLFSVLFICGGTAYLMHRLGLSYSIGAFFAGLMVSGSVFGRQVISEITPLRDVFFGLFFVTLGMLINPTVVAQQWPEILALTLLLIILKPMIIFFVLWVTGVPASIGLTTGLILFQAGEFSLVIMQQLSGNPLLNFAQEQAVMMTFFISLVLTPLAYRLAPKLGLMPETEKVIPPQLQRLAKILRHNLITRPLRLEYVHSKDTEGLKDHTIIIGFGVTGENLAMTLENLKIPYHVIEMNPVTVERLRHRGISASYGDGSNFEILERAGASTARLIVICVPGQTMTQSILKNVKQHWPQAQVLIRLQFMRELENYDFAEGHRTVVAEFETTLEMTAQTLDLYGVNKDEIQNFIRKSHDRLSNGRSIHLKI